MSAARIERLSQGLRRNVPVFAALGDPTRLALLTRLGAGRPLSIAGLTKGTPLTRQAITKHLVVLRKAGLVRGARRGRERLFELAPERLDEARLALDNARRQWSEALPRLQRFVESEADESPGPGPGVQSAPDTDKSVTEKS